MVEAQSELLASIDWLRGKWADAKGKYSREHTWRLAGGAEFKASERRSVLGERDYFASEDYIQRMQPRDTGRRSTLA
jgi:hypothetical protein